MPSIFQGKITKNFLQALLCCCTDVQREDAAPGSVEENYSTRVVPMLPSGMTNHTPIYRSPLYRSANLGASCLPNPVASRRRKLATKGLTYLAPLSSIGRHVPKEYSVWRIDSRSMATEFRVDEGKTLLIQVRPRWPVNSFSRARRIMRESTKIAALVHICEGATDVCLYRARARYVNDVLVPVEALVVAFYHVPASLEFVVINEAGMSKALERCLGAEMGEEEVSE